MFFFPWISPHDYLWSYRLYLEWLSSLACENRVLERQLTHTTLLLKDARKRFLAH